MNFVVTSLQDSVFQLFQRVENKHGWMLVVPYFVVLNFHFSSAIPKLDDKLMFSFKVSHALAYVTASKSGVSEPEIEDFISLDDKVEKNYYRSNQRSFRSWTTSTNTIFRQQEESHRFYGPGHYICIIDVTLIKL